VPRLFMAHSVVSAV